MELPVVPAISDNAVRFPGAFVLLALVLTASIVRLPAQENPCLTRTVPVNVVTNDFRTVPGLTSANFRGRYRGHPVEITSVKYDTGPRRIVILLDASGSMQYAWDAEIAAAQNVIMQASEKTSFAILTFAKAGEYKKLGFGEDRQALVSGLADLAGEKLDMRKTAILDALLEALAMLRLAKPGDAILLITDAEDNASRSRIAEVKAAFVDLGVRPFAVVTARTQRLPESGNLEPGTLARIIEGAGGASLGLAIAAAPLLFPSEFRYGDAELIPGGGKIMSSAALALCREISEFYAVEIRLHEAVDKERDWQLEVVGDIPEKHHLRVVYPHRLAPCQ